MIDINEEFGVEPHILIENRTGQFISSGKEILSFWMTLSENYPEMKRKIGIVLDIQQLYTVTRRKFLSEVELIPQDVLKGFHIHYRHRVPDISNEIPWIHVFNLIAEIEGEVLNNPEIHHKNRVDDAIRFCEGMRASAIIALSSLWNFIFTSIRVLMYLLIGILLGVNMSDANLFAAMVILILTIICFGSIGIISASFIMILKKGDPINMFFMGTSELFSGVLFPITVLPEWLQTVMKLQIVLKIQQKNTWFL